MGLHHRSKPTKNVRGKTALVTGGAMGMGLSWCEHFADDGANVVIWDINDDAMEMAAESIKRRGVDVFTHNVDVSKAEAVNEAAEKAQEETGGVDFLVNNAGIVHSKPFLDTDDAHLAATIDVDLKGVMWGMKAFLPKMIERNYGHIINMASLAAYVGTPRMPAYSASKWGVIGLTESVRMEINHVLGVKGVRFTVVCPGYVDTGMFEGAKPPRFTRLLQPEEVVRIAYGGFKQDKYLVNMPWLTKLAPPLWGALPYQAFDIVMHVFGGIDTMRDWRDLRR